MLRIKVNRAAARPATIVAVLAVQVMCVPVAAFAGTNGIAVVRKIPAQPVSTPIADGVGNLFGTSSSGGAYGSGFVYELVAPGNGVARWSFRKLQDFDGATVQFPLGRLASDTVGNLYGVSFYGGTLGEGALYELLKPATRAGRWRLELLHSFRAGRDGEFPYAGVTLGPDGTIYGTTFGGGQVSVGTAYTLSPPDKAGKRTYRVIHQFHGFTGRKDGANPESNFVFEGTGNLIGTTSDASIANGTVYELSPPRDGAGDWSFRTLYRFQGGADGTLPQGELTTDAAGHIFGTTLSGGTANGGTAFELTPPGHQSTKWTEQTIATFGTDAGDVLAPSDGVSIDQQGRLFGATKGGGNAATYCFGGVFRLTPPLQGSTTWTKDILVLLGQPNTVRLGCNPSGSLTPLVGGKFFGVNGEDSSEGTVYSVSP